MLVPQAGLEPTLPAVKVRNFNYWTARASPYFFKKKFLAQKIVLKRA